MVSKTEKLKKILKALCNHAIEKSEIIIRLKLRRLISGHAELVSRNAVTTWLNLLLGKGYIKPNPTSEIMSVKRNPYVKGGLYPSTKMYMPNNETRYFINIEKIKDFLKQNAQELSTHTLPTNKATTKQTSLSRFSKGSYSLQKEKNSTL